MKQKLLSLTLALLSIAAVAQTQTICFHENVDNLEVSTIVAQDGMTYTNLSFDGAVSLGEIGSPALPKVRHLIALPPNTVPAIKVKGYTSQEFSLKELGASSPLAPFQLSQTKGQCAEDVDFVVNRDIYAADAFVQDDIATVTVLGSLRGIQIAQVEINPVNYNPARGIIRQLDDIEVVVEYDAPTSEISIPAHLQSPYFDVVYKMMSNSDNITRSTANDFPDHPDLTKYPVRMLIVANRMFEETLKPYIEWKTQKGFDVEVAYTNEIGSSSSSIKSYIKGRYENAEYEGKAAPSFLVIVGDVNQVAASKTYEWTTDEFFQSDYMYAQMDKDAYERFPEMYYGRLSAETTEQLEAIIDKILYYEKYQFEDPSFLNRATIISGVDPQGAHVTYTQPQMKYLVANYLNAEGGYTTVNEYGVNDENNPSSSEGYAGCYDEERMRVGFLTYSAHADQYRWADPRLNIESLKAINNENQFPFVIANCCLSADFGFANAACIGEEFLRKPKGGAVTYIGSSPTSHWRECSVWTMGHRTDKSKGWTFDNTTLGAYDASFVSDYVSAGGILFVGNLAVTAGSIIGMVEKYWTGFNVLGDPSLIPYFTTAEPIEASYSKTIPVGSTSFTVKAPERSLVALSCNGDKLLASALVDAEGSVTLAFDAITESDNVTLVITKPQHQPIIANLSFGEDAIEDIPTSSTPETVEVFNLQGVRLRTLPGEAAAQATDDLAPGTYLVVSVSQADRKVEKVVVR